MASFVEQGALDSSTKFNFRDKNARFAFAVEGFLDKELKDDTHYVKWLARLFWKKNGVEGETILPYHYCTADELDEFAPPMGDSVGLFDIFKNSPTRHLFCLDWDKLGEDLNIWGTENDELNYQRFEYVLLPCNYMHAEFGPTGDSIAEECIADREQ